MQPVQSTLRHWDCITMHEFSSNNSEGPVSESPVSPSGKSPSAQTGYGISPSTRWEKIMLIIHKPHPARRIFTHHSLTHNHTVTKKEARFFPHDILGCMLEISSRDES